MGKNVHTSTDSHASSATSATLGGRLREERERLGLTQAQLAEAGRVHRRTQLNYESGERSPHTGYIDLVSKVGVDTWYVLGGVRREFLDFLESSRGALLLTLLGELGYEPGRVADILSAADETLGRARADSRSGNVAADTRDRWRSFCDDLFDRAPAISAIRAKSAELDIARLESVLTFIDTECSMRGVELPPSKRAMLAASLYRNAFSSGALDLAMAGDLFRLSMPGV